MLFEKVENVCYFQIILPNVCATLSQSFIKYEVTLCSLYSIKLIEENVDDDVTNSEFITFQIHNLIYS